MSAPLYPERYSCIECEGHLRPEDRRSGGTCHLCKHKAAQKTQARTLEAITASITGRVP